MHAGDRAHLGHAGEDGQGTDAHERIKKPRVEAWPLRGASERGEEGVRKHAQRVQTETQDPVKESLSSRQSARKAPVEGIGSLNVGNDIRTKGHTASKWASRVVSNSLRTGVVSA